MTVYAPSTEAKINDILTILGTVTRSFWPFYEDNGTVISCIGVGDMNSAETAGAAEDLEDDFAPARLGLLGDLNSYHFNPTGDHHLTGIDHADYSFVAAAFSIGMWIRPTAIASNVLLAKYDVVGTDREYQFWINAGGQLELELYDESVPADQTETATDALVAGQMQFVVATYDGVGATPDINLYVNGQLVASALVTTGAFVDVEAGATPLTIGCADDSAAPTNEFHGRMAMPFLTGVALTAAQVRALYDIMTPMVGIT